MKHKLTFSTFLLLALFLTLAPIALAGTTWHVNGVSGSDSHNCMSSATACKTVGHAIALAASGDSIMVAAATYSENLTISKSLKIIGFGASTTTIDGGSIKTVVTISKAAVVTLSGLTITHGYAHAGAGTTGGGGVVNVGVLTISYSYLGGNRAQIGCAVPNFCWAYSGGIYNSGTLTISNSSVAGNSVKGTFPPCTLIHQCLTFGGGIYNAGKMIISNSTVAGNLSSSTSGGNVARGGGIYNAGGSLMIINSTFYGNSVENGNGGGIMTSGGSVALQNSIVANNLGGNCNGAITSHGYNLSSDGYCSFNRPGDMNNTNPMLGNWGNHGGPTPTVPLIPGSPAIDAGNPSGCRDSGGNLLKTDQRGMPRPDKEDKIGCDIGAYEKQSD